MTLTEWKILPPEHQARLVDELKISPYTDLPLFKEIEAEFIKKFGNLPQVGKIRCSLGPGLGPYNAITVEIIRGKGRSNLPKRFLGFPVMKQYQKK